MANLKPTSEEIHSLSNTCNTSGGWHNSTTTLIDDRFVFQTIKDRNKLKSGSCCVGLTCYVVDVTSTGDASTTDEYKDGYFVMYRQPKSNDYKYDNGTPCIVDGVEMIPIEKSNNFWKEIYFGDQVGPQGDKGDSGIQLYWTSDQSLIKTLSDESLSPNLSYGYGNSGTVVKLGGQSGTGDAAKATNFNVNPKVDDIFNVNYGSYCYSIIITSTSASGTDIYNGRIVNITPIGITIYRKYESIAEMVEDRKSVPVGYYAAIARSSAEGVDSDQDNGKLYLRTATNGTSSGDVIGYLYIMDMSGIKGIQGDQGIRGSKWFTGDYVKRTWSDETESFTGAVTTNGTAPDGLQYGDFYMNTTPSTDTTLNHSEGDVFEYGYDEETKSGSWTYIYTLSAGGATANLNWEVI